MNLSRENEFQYVAKRALNDILDRFWEGDVQEGHFVGCCDLVLWELGMAVLMLETYYDATKDPKILQLMKAEWNYLQKHFSDEHEMTAPHSSCNPACDDAAWSAMTFLAFFRMTKDEKALDLAAETIRRSYKFWVDGDCKNGIWYRFGVDCTAKEYGWVKSVYCAGLLLSALEYHELTKGTSREDPQLLADTLALYEWVERDLRRDGNREFRTESGPVVTDCCDFFYYVEFTDNKETCRWAPKGIENPQCIQEAHSCSCLFGNTAMAAINLKLYEMFGDEQYLVRGLETANAFPNSPYDNEGVFVNDRDAWTNTAFMRYFTKLVLIRPEINPRLLDMLKKTALQIATHCRTAEGYYRPEWSGGTAWTGYPNAHTQVDQLKTTATSAHMIMAAALADSLGLFNVCQS